MRLPLWRDLKDMTELIWDGKYDKTTGKKIAPPRIALPFQTVETVNESTADRDRNLSLFGGGPSTEWRNRLIWGDKKYVLPSLLPEFAGKVNLIYIDPPFDTGANFSYLATIPNDPDTPGDHSASFIKEPSVIEQKAYRDTWGKGLDSYLKWFYETLVLINELLADDGSLYVHLDENVSHYAKAVLDEVFGNGTGNVGFRSEIIWKCTNAHSDSNRYGANHQTIFFYTKGSTSKWNSPLGEYDAEYVDTYYRYKEADGRRFKSGDLSAYGLSGGGYTYKWNGHTKLWRCPIETMQKLHDAGKVFYTKNGVARLKSYLDEAKGAPIQTIWADKEVQYLVSWGSEGVNYPTQKPEALLQRIIEASSVEDDLVLDCFCGSGTTAAVAEKLGRRWITCDLGRFAIHTARKRFLDIEGVKPFVVQNLGKYERQAWQTAEFGADAEAITQSYRDFILSLYRARPISGYVWLHGVKNGHMVHVGGVDAPISVGDVAQVAAEFKRSRGTGDDAPSQNSVDILGWDFAFELNEVSKQQAAQAGVDVRFIRIPREVLEKKAVEQGDIKFFELAALSVDVLQSGKGITLTLKDFVIPLDDVPQEVQSAITHWEQWIDYWAVDWDNKGDTFHNQWQSYRTRKAKTLQKQIASPPGTYREPGEYKVVVKVIDILGNDTTKTVKVNIP